MKSFTLSLAATLIFLAISCGDVDETNGRDENGRKEYEPVTEFDPDRNGHLDIRRAVHHARQTDRHVLVDVGGDWCPWCLEWDRFVEEDSSLATFIERNYVVVKVNYSKENENKRALRDFPEAPGYPHFYVLDGLGKLLHSQSTAELEKYESYDRAKVMEFLRAWAPDGNMPGKDADADKPSEEKSDEKKG
ncbi:MAG: DUF255 domain-containing protein [Ignavibacteriales bacterium]|nr:DUF255 domain-containing protein [Ignavibacteriales bacterium]